MRVGGQRHARPLYPRERPVTHCIGGWVGPRAVLDGCKNLASPGCDPRTVQPIASRYTDYAIPALQHFLVPYLKDHVFFAINNRYTIASQDSTHIFLLLKSVTYKRPVLPASVFFCVLALDHDLFCVFQYPSGCWHLITTSVLPLI